MRAVAAAGGYAFFLIPDKLADDTHHDRDQYQGDNYVGDIGCEPLCHVSLPSVLQYLCISYEKKNQLVFTNRH